MTHVRILLASLALAILAPAAGAADFNEAGTGAYVAIGDTVMVEDNHPYFVGKFSGAFVATGEPGRFANAGLMCFGYNDIGVGAGGYCVMTIGNGDKSLSRWSCNPAEAPAGAILAGDCTATFVSGTGSLAGITGTMPYQALIFAPNPDGTTSGVAVYTEGLRYTLP